MKTAWLNTPEATMALERIGSLEAALADPAAFLQTLSAVLDETARTVDLRAYLAERGLTIGQVVDMAADVAMAEPDANVRHRTGKTGLASPEARKAVATLWARGLAPEVVARVLNLPLEGVKVSQARRQVTPAERGILAAHFCGLTPSAVARKFDVPHRTALDVIRRHGETPHKDQAVQGRVVRQQVVQLYRQGRCYAEIMRLTGANRSQLRNALRRAHEKGELPEYGAGVR